MFKTVRSKISLLYVVLVVLIVILGVLSVFALSDMSNTISGLIKTNYDSIVRLSHMQDALRLQDRDALAYVYNDEPIRAAVHFDENAAVFQHNLENEQSTLIIPAEIDYAKEISAAYQEYLLAFEALLDCDTSTSAGQKKALGLYEGELQSAQQQVETAMDRLYDSNEVALFARRDEAAASARRSIWIMAVASLLAAGGGLLLATLYTKSVLAPLHRITETVKLVREGNLNHTIEVTTRDEFGMLAGEFNNMVRRLAEFERSTLGSLMSERSKSDSLVKSIHEPVVVLDENARVVMMNTAFERLYGLKETESLGHPLQTLAPGCGFDGAMQALQAGRSFDPQGHTLAVREEGEDLFYQLTATPIPTPEGDAAGHIFVMHDITEMKRLEKSRGDFIATISHEFKTPLTSIVMGADLIANPAIGPLNDDQQEVVETIREDSRRLETLVGEILELSRIESSQTIYHAAPCNLSDIISSSLGQFRTLAERSRVALSAGDTAGLPRVSADFSKVTWVLNNLLSNALKYTGEGGRVRVDAWSEEGHVHISVTDTGMGVPPEYAEKIFEKYVQIKGYDIEVRGSGLGLAAAREIIEAHGGRIWCDTALQTGSRFIFTLEALPEGGAAS